MAQDKRRIGILNTEQGLPSLTQPDPFFIFAYRQFVEPSFPNAGAAFDLACGLGRHSLWLASRNWQVSGVDLSEVAIKKLNHAALELNVTLDLFVGDAAEYKLESPRFDADCHVLSRRSQSFSQTAGSVHLSSGGLLICKSSLQWDSQGRLNGGWYRNPLQHGTIKASVHFFQNFKCYTAVNGRYVIEESSSLQEGKKRAEEIFGCY